MILDKRFRGKHIISPEIVLKMIQLISGSKDFHSGISKMIDDIQEVNSPYSFDKISLSTTLWTRK